MVLFRPRRGKPAAAAAPDAQADGAKLARESRAAKRIQCAWRCANARLRRKVLLARYARLPAILKAAQLRLRRGLRRHVLAVLQRAAQRRLAALRAVSVARLAVRTVAVNGSAAATAARVAKAAETKFFAFERGEAFLADLAKKRAAEPHPAFVRNVLARGWDTLTTDERAVLRAQRGERGIFCEGCGAVGMYSKICDVCAARAPKDPFEGDAILPLQDTYDSGFFWQKEAEASPFVLEAPEVPLYLPPVKRNYTAADEAKALAQLPKGVREPYSARSHGEMNLHIVLHKAMELIKAELSNVVPDFAPSILREPNRSKLGAKLPQKVQYEEQDYFTSLQAVPSARYNGHAHEHRAHVRLDGGDVSDLDAVTKRGVAYCFDRSQSTGQKREAELKRNYKADARAAKRNVHGHKDWLDVTSTHDSTSTTGKEAAAHLEKVESSFKIQGQWAEAQRARMVQKRSMCTHLESLVMREVDAEARRECLRVQGSPDKKQARADLAKLEKARAEAADKVMRVVAEYGLISSIDEAAYLTYTLDVSRRGDPDRKKHDAAAARRRLPRVKLNFSNLASMVTSDQFLKNVVGEYTAPDKGASSAAVESDGRVALPVIEEAAAAWSASEEASVASVEGSESSSFGHRRETSSSLPALHGATAHAAPRRRAGRLDAGKLYAPNVRSGDYANSAQSKQLRCIAADGPKRVRTGKFGDDSTIIPAVIPTAAFWSGGLVSQSPPTAVEAAYITGIGRAESMAPRYEKSLYAAAVFDRERALRRGNEASLPLWARMSERGPLRGQRQYSEIFGQPMELFFEPGKIPQSNTRGLGCFAGRNDAPAALHAPPRSKQPSPRQETHKFAQLKL